VSIKWDGTDEKIHAKITGIVTYGSIPTHNGKPSTDPCIIPEELNDGDAKENNPPSPASEIWLSPQGEKAIAKVNNNVYVVTIPQTGKTINISVADAANAEFPSIRLTEIGGEFPYWEANAQKVHFSLGAAHFVYDLNKSRALDDSLKLAKKLAEQSKSTDTTKKASVKKEDPTYKPEETWVKIYYKKDIPSSAIFIEGCEDYNHER